MSGIGDETKKSFLKINNMYKHFTSNKNQLTLNHLNCSSSITSK